MNTRVLDGLTGTAGPDRAGWRPAPNGDTNGRAPSIKYQPKSRRDYFDVGIGSVCLSGEDTGGKYCLLEVGLAPGMGVPRHTHTREDEVYFVLAGELEVIVGEERFVLKPGDTLMAPRDIPHQLRNSGDVENHYLLLFSPSGFEGFLKRTAVPAPNDAVAPTKPSAVAVGNVHELAAGYGILFG
jgi:quercetin dioxygenase-like cupin family protein